MALKYRTIYRALLLYSTLAHLVENSVSDSISLSLDNGLINSKANNSYMLG